MRTIDMVDVDLKLLDRLCHLPGRGAGTAGERVARDLLTERLEATDRHIQTHRFRMPVHYMATIWWMLGALIVGLLLLPILPFLGFLLCLAGAVCAGLFFDWRFCPASLLPPSTDSTNLVVTTGKRGQATNTLIIMAHYDSAPVSLAYHPKLVRHFDRSIKITLGTMVVACFFSLAYLAGWRDWTADTLRWLLVIHFFLNGLLASIDFWRFGYTQGANDNATGAVSAIALAERLWHRPPADTDVKLVLTSGEEHGMLGARAYFEEHAIRLDPHHTHILNIDTVGRGRLCMVEETGTLTRTFYDNRLTRRARTLALSDSRYRSIRPIRHAVADFDSVWFARAGYPCMTLAAYDENGLMPDMHRPEDTVEQIDPSVMRLTVDFAEDVVRHLFDGPKM